MTRQDAMGPDMPIATLSELLTLCLGGMSDAGIDVCVLHGYESLPDEIPSDVDFMVDPRKLRDIPRILAETLKGTNADLVQVLRHEWTCYYYVVALDLGPKGFEFLQLDSAGDYRRDGRVFLRWSDLKKARRDPRGFFVPPPEVTFYYYLIKKISKTEITDEQGTYLSTMFAMNPEGCAERVRSLFDSTMSALIYDSASANEWGPVQASVQELRHMMRKRVLVRAPIATIGYALAELMRRVGRLAMPTGLCVAVLGQDGTGKSTLVTQMTHELVYAFRRVFVYHWRPYVLGERSSTADSSAPHAQKPYSRGLSALKLLYLWLDNVMGWWFSVRPRLVRSTLVVFDRNFYDIRVDPRRYRYGGSEGLARLITGATVRPDISVVLCVDPEVARSRKNETDDTTARWLSSRYQTLSSEISRAVCIDAGAPMAEVAHEAERAVLDALRVRTARRLHL